MSVNSSNKNNNSGEATIVTGDKEQNLRLTEVQLALRPSVESLVEQNILKFDPTVAAPALQAAAIDLEKARLEDSLNRKLEKRPTVEDLKTYNIIKDTSLAPALQAAAADLQKAKLEDHLAGKLNRRPSAKELEEHNILKDQSVAPQLQAAKADLEHAKIVDRLEHKIDHRPNKERLVEQNIMKGMLYYTLHSQIYNSTLGLQMALRRCRLPLNR